MINDFTATSTDTYYARVTRSSLGDYSLIVTRDAAFDTEDNNNPATAQSLDATGAVLGYVTSLGQLLGADDGDGHLLLVDPATGAATIVASDVGGGYGFNDLALNPATGVLYGSQSLANHGLYTIDPASFAETYIGDLGGNVRALAWSPDGTTLYGFRDSIFGTINPTDATFTAIGDPGLFYVGGIAFQPGTGTLFAVQNIYLGLYTIDLATGVATFVGDPGDRYNSLEFLADGTLLAGVARPSVFFGGGSLVKLDPVTAAPTLIGTTVPLGYQNLTGLEESPATADFYRVNAQVGDVLQLATTTPADGPGQFANTLDPMIRVYAAAGTLVASDDNSALDGRNAQLSYLVPAGGAGSYYIQVIPSEATAALTSGEYVLSVHGATGALPSFQVTAVNPPEGFRTRFAPNQVTVDFNDSILLTSLHAGDLTVDGVPATGVTVVDGNTVIFSIDEPDEGTHEVRIAAGALVDLQGTPLDEFTSHYAIDLTPPTIVASSIQEGDVLPVGSLSYQVTFSEPMNTANLDASDFLLHGNFRGADYGPSSYSYDATGTILTVGYSGLPDDSYTLALYSGDGGFEDAVGWDLDGEPLAWPIPPNASGDGIEGGNFLVDFYLDVDATGPAAYPTPLSPKTPLGSLIYDPSVTGVINPLGDTDSFTIDVDAGQTITVLVTPGAGLQPTIDLVDPSNAPVGSVTAAASGVEALLQTVPATNAGTYTITVGGAGTTGIYTVQVVLNAALEDESHGGPANDTLLDAQDLDGSFINLTTGTAQRGAVVGSVSAPLLLFASNQYGQYLSVDRATGAATVIASGINGGSGYTDLARNPVTGVLYGSGARGDNGFYVVDPVTGAGTLIGYSGDQVHSLAWSPDGTTLYAVRNYNQFGTIDAGTGAFTFLSEAPAVFTAWRFNLRRECSTRSPRPVN